MSDHKDKTTVHMTPLVTPDEAIRAVPLLEALTPRQIELLLWQLVMDLGGGEIGTEPAEDVPGRELLVWPGENGYLDLCANERCDDE